MQDHFGSLAFCLGCACSEHLTRVIWKLDSSIEIAGNFELQFQSPEKYSGEFTWVTSKYLRWCFQKKYYNKLLEQKRQIFGVFRLKSSSKGFLVFSWRNCILVHHLLQSMFGVTENSANSGFRQTLLEKHTKDILFVWKGITWGTQVNSL